MTDNKSDLDQSAPIFIVGSKRGGTTLLRRVVDAHPDISIPPPSWIFHFIYPYLYSYGDLNQRGNFLELIRDCMAIPMVRDHWGIELSAEEMADRTQEKSFRAVFHALTIAYTDQKDGSPIWGSKSPADAFWIREVKRMFPGARFIFLYRDGRDVAADLAETIWGPRSAFSATLNWRRHMEAILSARSKLPAGSYFDLRYEDLVRAPEDELHRLCAFLGLPYSEHMLNYHKNPTDAFVTSSYHAKTNNPITDKYVGIYRSLPDDDREAIVTAAGDMLEKTGYSVDDSPREVGFWEQLRNAEADDHGGMMLRGGVEFMDTLAKKRNQAYNDGRWTTKDRIDFLNDNS